MNLRRKRVQFGKEKRFVFDLVLNLTNHLMCENTRMKRVELGFCANVYTNPQLTQSKKGRFNAKKNRV